MRFLRTAVLLALVFGVLYAFFVAPYSYVLNRPSFALTGDEKMFLYSLDPFPVDDVKFAGASVFPTPKGDTFDFNGYKVLGKVQIVDLAKRKAVAEALKSAHRTYRYDAEASFLPRYGLRVIDNDPVRAFTFQLDGRMEVHAKHSWSVAMITAEPKPLFDGILLDAGIALPPERSNSQSVSR